jgi:hypothetical protein
LLIAGKLGRASKEHAKGEKATKTGTPQAGFEACFGSLVGRQFPV